MKRLIYRYLMLLLFISASSVSINQLQAQNEQPITKEQKAILKKADVAYQDFKYSIAAGYYEKYLQTVSGSSNTVLAKLTDCYWQDRQYDEAFRLYKIMFSNADQRATKQQQLRIAELYARFNDYKHAAQWLKKIEGYQSKASGYEDLVKLKSMRKDSLNWHLGFLGINTSFREFSPFIMDSVLFFSSDRPDRVQETSFENPVNTYDRLWKVPLSKVNTTSLKMINSFQKEKSNPSNPRVRNTTAIIPTSNKGISPDKSFGREEFNKTIFLVNGLENIRYNIGAVSVDKNNHFYFSANYPNSDKRGINRLRLMEGYFTRNGSMKMKALPFGNPRLFTVMHPAISRDGNFLVISSDKPGSKGCYDLYYTQRKDINQPWDSLTAFGNNINTIGNEVFPTITANRYLYFSSDALPGLGGLDIYRIPLQDALAGNGEPQHLSYPVNSTGDDFGWTQDTTTINGYFTSDRLNNNNDLYDFHYKEPAKMLSLDNKVINRETMQPIDGATLFLYNKKDDKVYIAKTDKKGNYRFEVPDAKELIVKAMGKGFSSFCLPLDSVNISQLSDTVLQASNSFSLEKLKINYAWKLDVMYYDFNKSDLTAATRNVLDSLTSILKKYPISVEISSHTDSRGTVEYNERLSLRRSQAVVNYLMEHGIDSIRLIAKGYGKSKLINRCADGVPCTEQEHLANRRTEVKVVDYNVDQKSALDDVDPDKYKAGDVLNKKALPLGFFDECDPSSSQSGGSDKQTPIKKE